MGVQVTDIQYCTEGERGAEKRERRESSLNVPELVRYSGPHFLRESKWKITCQAVM